MIFFKTVVSCYMILKVISSLTNQKKKKQLRQAELVCDVVSFKEILIQNYFQEQFSQFFILEIFCIIIEY